MRVAIIGCGLIGQKRLRTLRNRHTLVIAADPIRERAEAMAAQVSGAVATTDWHKAVSRDDVEAALVATTNQWLAPVSLAAVNAGKHVLVEKPAARSCAELQPLIDAAADAKVRVQVGFNHRYHPAF